jgi:hypothetical protein
MAAWIKRAEKSEVEMRLTAMPMRKICAEEKGRFIAKQILAGFVTGEPAKSWRWSAETESNFE